MKKYSLNQTEEVLLIAAEVWQGKGDNWLLHVLAQNLTRTGGLFRDREQSWVSEGRRRNP
ncbi:hypothetical protein [Pseudooceanicola sp.]|uniref:hypothetical protein n=1 Tax=Pseudooceanicola sp. TaxID=1914328 RepID=UPI0035C723A9